METIQLSNHSTPKPSGFLAPELGEIVFYVLKDPVTGELVTRPALVINIYSSPDGIPEEKGMTQLLIFTCPWDDNTRIPRDYARYRSKEGIFVGMMIHGQPDQPGTWHHSFERSQ